MKWLFTPNLCSRFPSPFSAGWCQCCLFWCQWLGPVSGSGAPGPEWAEPEPAPRTEPESESPVSVIWPVTGAGWHHVWCLSCVTWHLFSCTETKHQKLQYTLIKGCHHYSLTHDFMILIVSIRHWFLKNVFYELKELVKVKVRMWVWAWDFGSGSRNWVSAFYGLCVAQQNIMVLLKCNTIFCKTYLHDSMLRP